MSIQKNSLSLPAHSLPSQVSLRLHRILRPFLSIGLIAAYPLSKILPLSWGWENGPFEQVQAVILIAGAILAYYLSRQFKDDFLRRFWLWTIPIWLVMAGRELNWGAAFYPPVKLSEGEPVLLSRSDLWYGAMVYPLLGVVLLAWLIAVVKYRLYRMPLQLVLDHCFPIFESALTFLAALLSDAAEHQRFFFGLLGQHHQVLEELAEFLFYLGLIATSLAIFRLHKKKGFMKSPSL
ncbi:hypothetical protein EDC14_102015 [Hydrogenispora ethanolica]|jgi:cell division protein FtsW (lipid II flippase)|uniref:Uncharacterized protein n=1 Tax=Hydrogenispora ethanolica TaxID=1082276 RepID=A0A4R1RCZ4_HYDET|nr:hypothetical protein [Hydrogenispora ethanolica]TCL63731.1 hypothetical protein EDC14_102015 [Hydrogenispora ethanolica]